MPRIRRRRSRKATRHPVGEQSTSAKRNPRKVKKTSYSLRYFVVRFTFTVIALLVIGGGGAFILMDHRVGNEILERNHSNVAVMLFDTFVLSPSRPASALQLRSELLARKYRHVEEATSEGEFSEKDGRFLVYRRGFRSSVGRVEPPAIFTVDTKRGIIAPHTGTPTEELVLEPHILAPLGLQEARSMEQLPLAEISPLLIDAVIAIEDQRFYQHRGIDVIGIGRALVENLVAGRIVQGGSTVTQQLAKNMLFSPERSLGRKILEALAALSLERRLSKDEILERYLNAVYLGQEGAVAIHGVAAATRTFFGKDPDSVTLSEAALLAGMIQAPSSFSPRRNLARALRRRDVVLAAMLEQERVSTQDVAHARAETMQILPPTFSNRQAPFYVASLRRELQKMLEMEAAIPSGVTVYSTLSSSLQTCAEEALSTGLAELDVRRPRRRRADADPLEGAIVAIEPFSGKVRAWVGGRDFTRTQFDRVDQARRPIGSTVKPFVYLTALDGSLNSYRVATPITRLPDVPLEIDLHARRTWNPENFDRTYRGEVSLREALELSLNMPSVYMTQRFGVPALARTLQRFDVHAQPPEVPALSLGAVDTSLLKLTTAFSALANGGIYVAPRLFLQVQDRAGTLLAAAPYIEHPIADEGAVFVLTDIMRGVLTRGTGRSARAAGFRGDAAGKTGTSNEGRDAWFVGFTPRLTVGVWVGYDDNTPTGLTGGTGPATLWGKFMHCAFPADEDLSFLPPPNVTRIAIDSSSGGLATPACPQERIIEEYFVMGTEPETMCPLHQQLPRVSESWRGDRQTDVPSKKQAPRSLWQRIFGD